MLEFDKYGLRLAGVAGAYKAEREIKADVRTVTVDFISLPEMLARFLFFPERQLGPPEHDKGLDEFFLYRNCLMEIVQRRSIIFIVEIDDAQIIESDRVGRIFGDHRLPDQFRRRDIALAEMNNPHVVFRIHVNGEH